MSLRRDARRPTRRPTRAGRTPGARSRVRTVRLQRSDHLGRRRHKPRAVAGHRRPLAQGLEDDDATPVRRLQCGRRRLAEPELGVRLVGRDHKIMPRREARELVVERQRRDRSGRVVRIVDPEDRRPVERRRRNRVEIWKKVVIPQQRHRLHIRPRKQRAAFVHRIRRLAVQHEPLVGPGIDEHLGQREDRLLRSVRRNDLRVGIEHDAEAACTPVRSGRAQLRQPLRERIRRALRHRRDEGLSDHRIGRLVRVALAEVDHPDAFGDEPPARLLETDERIRRHRGERGRDPNRHRWTVSTRNRCRMS